MPNRQLLSIPVYNEARYVAGVIQEARRYCGDLLVVDDGSNDGTSALLDEMTDIHVIRHAENRGYGKSLADAFCFAILG